MFEGQKKTIFYVNCIKNGLELGYTPDEIRKLLGISLARYFACKKIIDKQDQK